MDRISHVHSPPQRPVMIFDGDCGFCLFWVRRWRKIAGPAQDYIPFQDPRIAEWFPEIPRSQYEHAVQLVAPDGTVYGAAEAVFRSIAFAPGKGRLLTLYQKLPGFAPVSECVYRFIANHRQGFSTLTRWFWKEARDIPRARD